MSDFESGPCSGMEYETGAMDRLMPEDLGRGLIANQNAVYTWVVEFEDGGTYCQPVRVRDVFEQEEGGGPDSPHVVIMDLVGEDDEVEADSQGVFVEGVYKGETDEFDIFLHEDDEEGKVRSGYLRLTAIEEEPGEETDGIDVQGGLLRLNDFANGKKVEADRPRSRFTLFGGFLLVPLPRSKQKTH